MTKLAKIEKLSLAAIAEAVKDATSAEIREKMNAVVGAKINLSGEVLKKITRDPNLRLFIQPHDSPMTVFAEFTDAKQAETVAARKVRKTSKVSLTGEIKTFGYASVCLTNCKLAPEQTSPKKRRKR